MKKIFVFVSLFVFLVSASAFAACCSDKTKSVLPRTQTCFENEECDFLCFCIKKDELFKKLCLSDIQKCKANKIQENYEFDTLALRESIQCEEEKLNNLQKSCASEKEIKAQKKVIKNLRKDLKRNCKSFKDEFVLMLNSQQAKTFKASLKEKSSKKCD